MPVTPSPLRYPGGKTALLDLTRRMLQGNGLDRCIYLEPFAGGAGLALSLLFEGHARHIVLNDLDPSVWAFWHSALNHSAELAARVREVDVTIDEWFIQKEVQRNSEATTLELGFSTFFLNRTNRSGVLHGGVIGGKSQDGPYKLDCRYRKSDLLEKLDRIAKYRKRIELHMLDGREFLSEMDNPSERQFFFVDPPYFKKGSDLYVNHLLAADHADLAHSVSNLRSPWVLTYDRAPEIEALYPRHRHYTFGINYSAAAKRVGQELLVVSESLQLNVETFSAKLPSPLLIAS